MHHLLGAVVGQVRSISCASFETIPLHEMQGRGRRTGVATAVSVSRVLRVMQGLCGTSIDDILCKGKCPSRRYKRPKRHRLDAHGRDRKPKEITMPCSRSHILIRSTAAIGVAAFSLLASTWAVAQTSRSDTFAKLVDFSATRLDISRKVALTKWDTNQPIADPPSDPREQQVIAGASEEAKSRGLPSELAAAFFADQIEASKLIQFALMANWRRAGQVPAEPRADLKTELRPALDKLRSQFIDELLATQRLRAAADCKTQIARAAAMHVESHRLMPLEAIALDRGLARVCGD